MQPLHGLPTFCHTDELCLGQFLYEHVCIAYAGLLVFALVRGLRASHAWRSFGVLLAEIITGDPPSKRFGLREPMCAHTLLVSLLQPTQHCYSPSCLTWAESAAPSPKPAT